MSAADVGIAVATSIVVAGLLADHSEHELARPVLASSPAIPAHVAFESYSVSPGMPLPGRLSAAVAGRLLGRAFAGRFVSRSAPEMEVLLADLPRLGIVGGAVCDSVVAATALRHGLRLRSLDRCAAPTYDAIEVAYDLI